MLHRSWFSWTLAMDGMDAVADTRCWDSAELWLAQQVARAAARAAAPDVPALELTPAAKACPAFAAHSLLGKRKKEADEDV
jgi:hypothetical protein